MIFHSHAEPKNEVILGSFLSKLDISSTTVNNDGKKETMKSPIPKKKIKPNRDIRIMFGEMSKRHNEGIPEFLDSGRKRWTLDSGFWTFL